jgi:hypothetical protein
VERPPTPASRQPVCTAPGTPAEPWCPGPCRDVDSARRCRRPSNSAVRDLRERVRRVYGHQNPRPDRGLNPKPQGTKLRRGQLSSAMLHLYQRLPQSLIRLQEGELLLRLRKQREEEKLVFKLCGAQKTARCLRYCCQGHSMFSKWLPAHAQGAMPSSSYATGRLPAAR